MNLDNPAQFNVDFCNDMTMTYSDDIGQVKFDFDLAADRPKAIVVYRGKASLKFRWIRRIFAEDRRIYTAFDRVVAYLQDLGWEVVIFD